LRASVAFACYVAGTVAFVRFFLLVPRLRKEQIDSESNWLRAWLPWSPGSYTPEGEHLRRRMRLFVGLGWILLIAGIILSPR